MLVPLTREKFEQIVPRIATGPQYAYCWGKLSDLLRRLLYSVVALVVILLLGSLLGDGAEGFILILSVIAGLYWFWSPVYLASLRNATYRRYKYSGFWRAEILDVFITEELIREEEKVNKEGRLVIVENTEKKLNLTIGDETGFTVEIQAPVRRIYQAIAPGQTAELLLLSNRSNLDRIDRVSDAYIPSQNLWVGEYPYLQRDVFTEVSRELGGEQKAKYRSRSSDRSIQRRLPNNFS